MLVAYETCSGIQSHIDPDRYQIVTRATYHIVFTASQPIHVKRVIVDCIIIEADSKYRKLPVNYIHSRRGFQVIERRH